MSLNNRIEGAVDVFTPQTMEEALEKAFWQEYKIKRDESIRDNKRYKYWILEETI